MKLSDQADYDSDHDECQILYAHCHFCSFEGTTMDSLTAFPYSEFLLLRWDKLQLEYDLSFNVKGYRRRRRCQQSLGRNNNSSSSSNNNKISMMSEHDHVVVAIDIIDLLDSPVVAEDDDCRAFSSISSTSMDDTRRHPPFFWGSCCSHRGSGWRCARWPPPSSPQYRRSSR